MPSTPNAQGYYYPYKIENPVELLRSQELGVETIAGFGEVVLDIFVDNTMINDPGQPL